ncbi:Serine/threonine-protein kinase [Ceratobasidium sp. AG-Ba]|nr:Serine/threonine-protein kinase [Ceratobasidium sp. AG-Ba]
MTDEANRRKKVLSGRLSANTTDPYAQRRKEDQKKWEKARAKAEEEATKQMEAVHALSNDTPISILPPQPSTSGLLPPNPIDANPTEPLPYETSPKPAATSLLPAAHLGIGVSANTLLIPTLQRPNSNPRFPFLQSVHGSLGTFSGQTSRKSSLKQNLESLGSRCDVLLQRLSEVTTGAMIAPAYVRELARIQLEVERAKKSILEWYQSETFGRHKDDYSEVVKIEKKIEHDFAAFEAINQQLTAMKLDEMSERLNASLAVTSKNSRNIEQVDDSEFRRHIKNLLGEVPQHLLVLKGRIYDRGRVPISQGVSFHVYEALMAPSGEKVAIKLYCERISTNGEGISYVKRMMRHAGLWTSFCHESILECYGVNMQLTKDYSTGDDRIQFYMVSPFLRHGNANDYIRKKRKANLPIDVLQIIKQAALGIQYLHNRDEPCVHASMRGENILIKEDGTACINGFGLTKALPRNAKKIEMTEEKSPYRWMAPELIKHPDNPTLKPSCDVWSWAMTCLELMSGLKPYHKFKELDGADKIVAGCLPKESDYPEFRQHCPQPDMMWELLQRCWNMDPEKRPTIHQVIDELESIERA